MMEMILLITILILELAGVIACFSAHLTRGSWRIVCAAITAAECIIAAIVVLLSKTGFNFRFYVLAAVLLVKLIVSLILFFISRKSSLKMPGKPAVILKLIGTCILLTAAAVPSLLFADYTGLETGGPYQVKTAHAIIIDESREETYEQDGSKREIPIYVYYPETQEGSYPLVLFSHGAFGYYQSNSSTYMELASRGYVVVSMDHPYHSFFTKDTNGRLITVDTTFIQEVMSINQEETPNESIYSLSQNWLDLRVGDMNAVIDVIKDSDYDTMYVSNEQEKNNIRIALSMADCGRIGLMGHSLGGAESVAVGRMRDDISAVIDLDGTMLGERTGVTAGTYLHDEEPYPVPLLTIDNQEHHDVAERLKEGYVNYEILKHARDGHNTYFAESGHMNFTDLVLFAPFIARMLGTGSIDSEACIRRMNDLVVMYFDYYLKNEGELNIADCYR